MPQVTADKETFELEVKPNGRVVLPAALRAELGLKPGDRFLVKVRDENHAELVTVRAALASVRGMFAHLPGPSLADELIADRRAEAERE